MEIGFGTGKQGKEYKNADGNGKREKNGMKQKTGMEKAAEFFFFASLLLELVIVIIDKSDYINPLEGQLFRITFLLAAVKVLLTKYSKREWLWMCAFGILGLVSYKATGRNEILRIVAFVAACKNVDLRKMMSFVFYVTAGGCVLLMVLSLTGIYGNPGIVTDFGRGVVETRYCLGLGHPNALHCMFFMLVLLGLYLYGKKMKIYQYLCVFLLNVAMYLLTDSRTGMAITAAAILLTALFRFFPKWGEYRWVYLCGIVLFLACLLLSVAASKYGLTKPFLKRLDDFLNGRILDLYWGSVNHEGTVERWSLFSEARNTYYFDMGFVRVFYWYGILPAIVYFAMNLLLIWECYKKRDTQGFVMMVVLAVYTVVEAHIISVYIGRNYLLLLFGVYWSDMLHAGDAENEEYAWGAYRLLKHG